MIRIVGYQLLEKIYEGSRTLVYRGISTTQPKPVILKLLKAEYPSFTELVRFRNQYTIAKNLNIPGVVKPLSLENYRNSFALIMADEGCIALSDYRRNEPLSLNEFFPIAIQIAKILEGLYINRVIHKDIKPPNILIHPETKEVKIIDFSIASLLPRETQILQNLNVIEGTLAYISPEQTGRMNRGLDYRTDFYSLGVTFYELLTGKLPFQATEPIELIHCHIARQPTPPIELNQNIPQILNDIVVKLMAKTAEYRYQSARGLRHDLEICQQQYQATGKIVNLTLGERDITEQFIIPEKLYGREAEVETLLAAFDRVSEGATELMLVAGFSGIGKTAVVNEVHKPIVRQRGYFVSGKFDQFQRNIPFYAIAQALRHLMRQLLTENAAQLAQWRSQILSELGENAQVIIDVIPELEQIIGQQPEATELTGNAVQNRFNLLFSKFVQMFATRSHPLVIFLDDLQWVDTASLALLKLLMSETSTPYLLIVGAYRDNEVSPVHPLMLTLAEIREAKATVNQITLAPLDLLNLNRLIADTLNCNLSLALPLTKLVLERTKGNPFFTNQLLKYLYEDGLIAFNLSGRYWECDMAGVKAKTLTDNVVEFMAIQLQKLPKNTQQVLQLAACIGNQFDLNTLAIVNETAQAQTATDLWRALQEGLVIPISETYKFFQSEESVKVAEIKDISLPYKFLHDRVQQAAYSLIPEADKKITHLTIGRLLLKNTNSEQSEERIFEIVNQLNMGIDLITNQSEKDELAKLNLIAAQKAKAATAYESALKYFNIGLILLPDNSWENDYDLTLNLHVKAAEAAYLNTDFEQIDKLTQLVLQKARNLLDKVKIYEVKILSYVAQNNMMSAIQTGRQILQMLGVTFPENPTFADIQLALQETALTLKDKRIEELIDLPQMTDAYQLAAMRMIASISPAAYQASPLLFPLLVLKRVMISIQYGNASESGFTYGSYGIILCGVVGDIDTGYQFGNLALNLLSQLKIRDQKAKILVVFNGNTLIWKQHLKHSLKPLLEAYQSGMETGDLEFAGYAVYIFCFYNYFCGKELAGLERDLENYSTQLAQIKQEATQNYHNIYWQAVLNLLGKSANPCLLVGEGYDEVKNLPIHQERKDIAALFHLYFNKLILGYLFQEFLEAVSHAAMAEQYLASVTSSALVPIFYFYASLAKLAIFPEQSFDEKEEIIARVNANQEKMQNWANHAPMNFLHKFYLVEAEKHRVLGEKMEAMEMYDRAISLAKENGYIQEKALARELAAKFYLAWGKTDIAETYMTKAYYAYARWGAKAKVNDLEKRYPQLLAPILTATQTRPNLRQTVTNTGTVTSTGSETSAILDLSAVLKTFQTLSEAIELNKLLSTVMKVALENAGASQAALILPQSDQWVIAASVTADRNQQQLDSVVPLSIGIEDSQAIPRSIINYVKNTLKTVALDDATTEKEFAADSYIQQHQPKSILCTPLLNQGELIGILYLENRLAKAAFTKERLQVLKLLSSQAAISLKNANLYHDLQLSEAREREKAEQLAQSLHKLQEAQLQLIQNEKMSALGNLMAGLAHEINNPVGFIAGNVDQANTALQDLINYLQLYQEKFPNPGTELEEKAEDIELEYILEDLPQMLGSMKTGAERIREISSSMRTFSRADTSSKVLANIHEGIDSTLMILQYRLKPKDTRPAIQVIKEYGEIPQLKCYFGQLNQVFMNILGNAIDALDEANQGRSFAEITANPNQITICTEVLEAETAVVIRIKDNAAGMSDEVKERVFDHLFTTKAVGKGTGLGLSISRQIVEEKHGGKLSCISVPGEGTEFTIQIPI
ncbi:trifunctional serine/threonine-protein kinase/ATP-binding protein/sensor histidine kinase [Argonema antarcticum]|uniref:trifunctional serine/threonine-protein kinase/ATP-binding protein/sensor histidine kinase n=1 Tax=Argonema antarcticum TaxID=2942763 RepID=UPI0020114817|nr:ATP-binding sensor histidine kinase [Argonema antarcticum]MCL1473834.1 AAA family ATPase [Argonema antarcticum A004/B2]